MAGRRRSKAELIRDRRVLADLYLQGWTQTAIAAEIGMSQQTVSRDLKALHKQWVEAALMDLNEAKARELAKIDRLEREYWDAWERSCQDSETERVKQRKTEDGKEVREGVKVTKGQAGDASFLRGIQWCIERRCKILGIDAPDKHDLRMSDGPMIMMDLGANGSDED